MLHYYKIESAESSEMISIYYNANNRHLKETKSINVSAYDHRYITLSVSRPEDETSELWGSLFTKKNDKMVPISKFYSYGITGAIPLYVAVTESQVAELDAQLEQKLADFNKAETESRKEMDEKHDKAYEIYQDIESTIAGYERTHPLTGSPKQIAWANQIRESAFTSLVFDDPDNAEMRIQRTLDNPERQKAKFWIDNRKSFGY
ncbi:hypothetical protein [Brucella gallinifaecis]|uniref:hypothetical protein n=1 Tax=Brucella gallinifaecis TaxID=215590 RepID=UPI00235FC8CC|nr:hypothetical protein [Brucella gallinifaecis]